MNKLNEIKERWSKTTPGDWLVSQTTENSGWAPHYGVKTSQGYSVVHAQTNWEGYGNGSTQDDATAIAHAPSDVEVLTKALEGVLELCEIAETNVDGTPREAFMVHPDAIRFIIAAALGDDNE